MGGQLWWAMCFSGNHSNFLFLLCVYSSVVAMWKINFLSLSYNTSRNRSLSKMITTSHSCDCYVAYVWSSAELRPVGVITLLLSSCTLLVAHRNASANMHIHHTQTIPVTPKHKSFVWKRGTQLRLCRAAGELAHSLFEAMYVNYCSDDFLWLCNEPYSRPVCIAS